MAEDTSNKKAWRFYRSNLSTKVWDKENNRLLADFTEGTFTTGDARVARKLQELGYVQIALDATQPPDVVVQQPAMVIDGDVPMLGPRVMEGAKVEEAITSKMKPVGGPKPPEVIQRVK